jgi:hypothetical protein
MQPYDELEALPSTVPCSMCQLEAAPLVFSSVARCLTCRDTVCVAHLKAHNSVHKGHGHKVFFLSNQNLAQFAQSAADCDSPSNVSCPTIRSSVVSPDVLSTGAAQSSVRPLASSAHPKETIETTFSSTPAPLQWRQPVGYFGSSAEIASADMPWAASYDNRVPWVDLSWNAPSLGAAAAADESQLSPLFVGERSVRLASQGQCSGGDGFSGGLW